MPLYEIRKFVAPEFIFGVGARHRVGYYAKRLSAHRVLIVSDAGVINSGWVDDVISDLAEVDITAAVFSGLTPNPKDHEVMRGAGMYWREQCDVIVAVGGGSVMDCAKAIGIVHANGADISEFEGIDCVRVPGPPLICIPTTAGTSADISQFCIIVNSLERYKMAIISKTIIPDVALIDPETTLTLPPYLTACTGLDALTHAIKAHVSTANSPFADVHALSAIRLIWNNLELAVTRPDFLDARENMVLGSLQAGLAFSNTSLGAVHALSHSVGGYLDLPHGECNALLLEHVIRFNMKSASKGYAQVGEAMGFDMRGMSEATSARKITEALEDMRRRVNVTAGLTSRGINISDIPHLAEQAYHDACLVTNPRRAGVEDLKVIYAEAL